MRIAKMIIKRNKGKELDFSDIKIYYKAIVIKSK